MTSSSPCKAIPRFFRRRFGWFIWLLDDDYARELLKVELKPCEPPHRSPAPDSGPSNNLPGWTWVGTYGGTLLCRPT